MSVIRVIVHTHKHVVITAREIRCSLFCCELRKVKQNIVFIPRLILDAAMNNVNQHGKCALMVFDAHLFRTLKHPAEVHICQSFEYKFKFVAHGSSII